MVDVPLKHLIGTVALIGLVASAGLSYTMITSFIEAGVLRQQLKEIGEYVSLNLGEIVALVNFADYLNNVTMMKILNLPPDVGGRAYVVELNEIGEDHGRWVHVYLSVRREIVASSPIPLNTTGTQVMFITSFKGILLVRGGRIEYSGVVYGGTPDIVVWGWRRDDETTWAGIGVWKA